jgi:hypothetical protein
MEIAAAPVSPAPRTVEDIYKDFYNRRTALVRALTVGKQHRRRPLLTLSCFSCVLDLTCRHLNPRGFVAPADVDDFFGYCDPGKIRSDLRGSNLFGSCYRFV